MELDAKAVKELCSNIVGITNNFCTFSDEQHTKTASEDQSVPVQPQIFFRREPKNIVLDGDQVKVPFGHLGLVSEVHFGVIIESECSECTKDKAMEFVAGYVAVLSTRIKDSPYDAHNKVLAETQEFPSDIAITPMVHKKLIEHANACIIWANVDDKEFQRAPLTEMIKTISEVIERASQLVTLTRGDLVLCGTPAGSQYIHAEQTIEFGIEGHVRSRFPIVKNSEVLAAEPAHNSKMERESDNNLLLPNKVDETN